MTRTGPADPVCLFEDRPGGWSLRLDDFQARIAVHRRTDLPAAWRSIEDARRQGCWVALLLDYELGEWLEDGLHPLPAPAGDEAPEPIPRLTALVYAQAREHGRRDAPRPADVGTPPSPAHPPADPAPLLARPGCTRAGHARAVETIRAGIARGDYYQVNHTLPLWLDWPGSLDPESVYRELIERHPVPHGACIRDGDRWILSLSPELFVARRGTRLSVRPMKGTAPRHADPVLDREAGQALSRSAKNRAENLMIVDLLRNDLGRIAAPGSVRVPALFDLERYPSVWTLTSLVQAEAPAAPLAEVLRALFPCGSVTGAPKIAAMRAIRALEARRRGIYCGSVGWLAPDGDFSLNVAIRTIEIRGGRAEFGVGGGIVADSRADEEWQECLWKARILNRWSLHDAAACLD